MSICDYIEQNLEFFEPLFYTCIQKHTGNTVGLKLDEYDNPLMLTMCNNLENSEYGRIRATLDSCLMALKNSGRDDLIQDIVSAQADIDTLKFMVQNMYVTIKAGYDIMAKDRDKYKQEATVQTGKFEAQLLETNYALRKIIDLESEIETLRT